MRYCLWVLIPVVIVLCVLQYFLVQADNMDSSASVYFLCLFPVLIVFTAILVKRKSNNTCDSALLIIPFVGIFIIGYVLIWIAYFGDGGRM